ncbi:hypothetical protein NQ637_18165 [Acinetobacter baumannii]|nr:hypothetical protein [Acinetobacter baumannii]
MSEEENKSLKILKIIIKHTGLGVTDALLFGAGSKIYDTYKDIREYSKKCNEALYAKQLESFLNSMDISQQDFEEFFSKNPDNLRLGLETVKILEQTILEKQAEMLARAFQLYIRDDAPKNKTLFHKNVHIITKIDYFLIDEIEKLTNYPVNPPAPTYQMTEQGLHIDLDPYVSNPHKELIDFGFLVLPKMELNTLAASNIFEVSLFFEFFYQNIFKDPKKDN